MYQNSYAGKVAKGYDALQMKEYQTAEKYFKHAIGKNAQKPEAYSGLAETYMEQGGGRRSRIRISFGDCLLSIQSKNCIGQQSAFMKSQNNLDKISGNSWETVRMKSVLVKFESVRFYRTGF